MLKEIHFPSAILGGIAGSALVQLMTRIDYLHATFPCLFKPFWGFALPIAVAIAFAVSFVAATLAPPHLSSRTGDMTGVIIGVFTYEAVLHGGFDVNCFVASVAYGFVGFCAGSIAAGLKGVAERERDDLEAP
jgi:hypothetical protein